MKITEKTVADTLRDTAHVLVTQQEAQDDGTVTESLRRVPLSAFNKGTTLLVTVSKNEDGTYTANKTYQEITDAAIAGKTLLCCYYDDDVYLTLSERHGMFTFATVVDCVLYQVSITNTDQVSCKITNLASPGASKGDIADAVQEYMAQNPVSATCVPGTGAPTTATVGTVGSLWMDTNTGNVYKCTAAADSVYTWVNMDEQTLDHQHYFDITADGEVSLKPSYRGTGSSTYPASVGDGLSLELPNPLVIPNSINGIEVTALAPGMFYGNNRVKEIELPPTVTTIPEHFCREATNLRAVHNTGSIIGIGKAAFMSTRIKEALFPNLTTLGVGAFVGSAYLEIVDIGQVTTISNQVFANCAFLRKVIGGENVDSIGSQAFYYTRSLRDLPLLAHVTSVADYAFFGSSICTSLSGDGIASKAFPIADNNTDFWSGVPFTPCRNRIATKLSQLNPAWKNENVLQDTYAITYSNACALFVVMHIHSAITGKYYADPREFVDELKSDPELSKFLYHDNWPGEFDNVAPMLEALGYHTEVRGVGDDNNLSKDDYQTLVDALAAGAYIYTQAGIKSSWDNDYFDGGHAVMLYGINDFGEVCVLDSNVLHEYFRETGFESDADVYTYTMPYQNLVGSSSNLVIVYPPNVEIDSDDTDYIKAPDVAVVGQTIVVKSVDSNGKPTEWKAVDLPTVLSVIDNGNGTVNRSVDELTAAYQAGQSIVLYDNGYVAALEGIGRDDDNKYIYTFRCHDKDGTQKVYTVSSPNVLEKSTVEAGGESGGIEKIIDITTTKYNDKLQIPIDTEEMANKLLNASELHLYLYVPRYAEDTETNTIGNVSVGVQVTESYGPAFAVFQGAIPNPTLAYMQSSTSIAKIFVDTLGGSMERGAIGMQYKSVVGSGESSSLYHATVDARGFKKDSYIFVNGTQQMAAGTRFVLGVRA